MRIKDIENELGITKSNIRFYEKQGLLNPDRTDNGYREYSAEDLELLKKIVVYRKLGISVENIKRIFDGAIDLQTAVAQSVSAMEQEMEKLNGSIELCRVVQKRNETDEMLNQDYYFDLIHADEKEGKQFVDILRDYAQFEKQILYRSFQPHLMFDKVLNMEALDKKGKIYTVSAMLLICVASGFAGKYLWHWGFVLGFFRPFLLFVIMSVLLLPYYLLKDRSEKATKIWLYVVMFLICAAVVALLGVAVATFLEILSDVTIVPGN